MNYDQVKCPHCLSEQELEDLVQTTAYSCWAGEDNGVECLNCEKNFNVRAEHAGFQATEDFDLDTFVKSHKIEVPANLDRYWVRCFLGHFAEDYMEFPKSYETDMDSERLSSCKASFEFALQKWNEIKEKI